MEAQLLLTDIDRTGILVTPLIGKIPLGNLVIAAGLGRVQNRSHFDDTDTLMRPTPLRLCLVPCRYSSPRRRQSPFRCALSKGNHGHIVPVSGSTLSNVMDSECIVVAEFAALLTDKMCVGVTKHFMQVSDAVTAIAFCFSEWACSGVMLLTTTRA